MGNSNDANWTIAVLVREPPAAVAGTTPGSGLAIHQISGRDAKDQWSQTIDVLLRLSDGIADATAAWRAEEIEVGLTLSAKGELLFIAEAGTEPSVKVTLKRKAQTPESASWSQA